MAETANDIKEVGLAAIDAGKDIGNNIGDAIGEIGAIGEMAIDGISKISVKANYEQAKATRKERFTFRNTKTNKR